MAKLIQKYQGEDIKINFKYRDKATKALIDIDSIDELVVLLYTSDGAQIKGFYKTNLTGSYTSSLDTGSLSLLTRIDNYQYYGWIQSGETKNAQPGTIKSETKFLQYYPELSQSKLDNIAKSDIFELVKANNIKNVI